MSQEPLGAGKAQGAQGRGQEAAMGRALQGQTCGHFPMTLGSREEGLLGFHLCECGDSHGNGSGRVSQCCMTHFWYSVVMGTAPARAQGRSPSDLFWNMLVTAALRNSLEPVLSAPPKLHPYCC